MACLGLLVLAACKAGGPSASDAMVPPKSAYVMVLGTAQDGGLPQMGCRRNCCLMARNHPERRRAVTSLLLVDPQQGRRWLFDASPDLPDQVELCREHPPSYAVAPGRPALFDGIFLTHAHMGHYSGLLHLGREAYASQPVVTYVSARMHGFLSHNGPWNLLVEDQHLQLRELPPNVPLDLGRQLSVTAIPVPHRDEYSDTYAFRIDGPQRSLLYLPDIDKWEKWEEPIEGHLRRVDYALLDGTFYADGEVPGRSMAEIAHPFIQESIARLQSLSAGQRQKVYFTHLNHSNPAADPESEAAAEIQAQRMSVAFDGQIFRL
jgi:pyrroloquinoline quinone biosynthesis protein B